jgi:hypothetical protein
VCQRAPSVRHRTARCRNFAESPQSRRSKMKETRFATQFISSEPLPPTTARPAPALPPYETQIVRFSSRPSTGITYSGLVCLFYCFICLPFLCSSIVFQPVTGVWSNPSVLCSSLCCVALPISFNDSSPSNAQCLLHSFSFCLIFFYIKSLRLSNIFSL